MFSRATQELLTNMEFRVSFHVPRRRMPLNWSEMTSNVDLTLWSEVLEILVPEQYNLALRHKQCELVEAFLAEFRDLSAFHLRAEVWAEVFRRNACRQQVRLCGVSTKSWVAELKDLRRREFLVDIKVRVIKWIRGTLLQIIQK